MAQPVIPNLAALFAIPPPPVVYIKPIAPANGQILVDDFCQRRGIALSLENSITEPEDKSTGVLKPYVLSKRKRRRLSKNRKKKLNFNKKVEDNFDRRQQLHQQIDAWRKEKHEQLLMDKVYEENKSQWQKSLAQNAIKTREATELIDKLKSAVFRLKNTSDLKTMSKLNQLMAVWTDAHSEYVSEKKVLEEKLRINSQDKIISDIAQESWLTCLFGDSFTVPSSIKSFEEFCNIRCSWDLYISDDTNSSQIPLFYVVPPFSSSKMDVWSSYMHS